MTKVKKERLRCYVCGSTTDVISYNDVLLCVPHRRAREVPFHEMTKRNDDMTALELLRAARQKITSPDNFY
jgi:hypothetical protein